MMCFYVVEGHDYNEEHHGEKKSVIKKVKEKAKKLKNTITKHGHGHGDSDQHQDHQDEEDDDDDEMEKDAEVHGAPSKSCLFLNPFHDYSCTTKTHVHN